MKENLIINSFDIEENLVINSFDKAMSYLENFPLAKGHNNPKGDFTWLLCFEFPGRGAKALLKRDFELIN